MTRPVQCGRCLGLGSVDVIVQEVRCPDCQGAGVKEQMTMTGELTKYEHEQRLLPALSIGGAVERFNAVADFARTILRQDVDYGIIPGTPKPSLLKPGAEKLTTFFGLSVRFQVVERTLDWTGAEHGGQPFFYFEYRCQLYRDTLLIAESDGSCNSKEKKYAYRWVPAHEVPEGLDVATLPTQGGKAVEFAFAIDKAETGGQYGKPASYWQRWQEAIASGQARAISKATKSGKQMDAWEMDSTLYRVPNPDIADQVNTIQKMAQKRALIAAVLIGVNASEYFTQDLEDLVIEGSYTITPAPAAPAPAQPARPAHAPNLDDTDLFDTPAREAPAVVREAPRVQELRDLPTVADEAPRVQLLAGIIEQQERIKALGGRPAALTDEAAASMTLPALQNIYQTTLEQANRLERRQSQPARA